MSALVQSMSLLVVIEYQRGQPLSVDTAILMKNTISKLFHNFPPCRSAWFYDCNRLCTARQVSRMRTLHAHAHSRGTSLAPVTSAIERLEQLLPFLASTSASMMGHPSSTNISLTVDFPLAIPPVSPNINIPRARE